MKRGKKDDWQVGAEATFQLLTEAMESSIRLAGMLLAENVDVDAAESTHAEAKDKLVAARSSFMRWHDRYHPAKVKRRYFVSVSGVDAGMRRMLGGVQVTLSVARPLHVAKDQEEFDFLMMAAANARTVFDDNASFVQACGSATPAQLVEVKMRAKPWNSSMTNFSR